jgi:hypothetical protein
MAAPIGYRVNAPDVIHQIIDGEAVIIHLGRGFYYSLDDVGADVWRAVERRLSRAQVVATVAAAYEGADVAAAVGGLLDQMIAEELIVEAPADAGSDVPIETRGHRAPFVPPVLHKYTDLQDLLLLDPIHQVDETGWPETPAVAPRSDGGR